MILALLLWMPRRRIEIWYGTRENQFKISEGTAVSMRAVIMVSGPNLLLCRLFSGVHFAGAASSEDLISSVRGLCCWLLLFSEEIGLQVLTMTACSRIMGELFTNSIGITILAWAVALLIMAINLSAIYEFAADHLPRSPVVLLVFLLILLFYLAFIVYLALGPVRWAADRFVRPWNDTTFTDTEHQSYWRVNHQWIHQ